MTARSICSSRKSPSSRAFRRPRQRSRSRSRSRNRSSRPATDPIAERATVSLVSARLPEWIREKRINLAELHEIKSLLREKSLHSVCESLACPNRTECFTRGTATFMILGDVCTRACSFCNVTTGRPYAAPSPDEPRSVAEAARRMNLRHVVVTCVTRDDLLDGGAHQFAATIHALRDALPDATVEVLTSDFHGNAEAVRVVVEARPDYFNHNVETVPR